MWLPREAVHASLQLLLNDVPEVPSAVIWKFLRDINRVCSVFCRVPSVLICLLCFTYTRHHMKISCFRSLLTLSPPLHFVLYVMPCRVADITKVWLRREETKVQNVKATCVSPIIALEKKVANQR